MAEFDESANKVEPTIDEVVKSAEETVEDATPAVEEPVVETEPTVVEAEAEVEPEVEPEVVAEPEEEAVEKSDKPEDKEPEDKKSDKEDEEEKEDEEDEEPKKKDKKGDKEKVEKSETISNADLVGALGAIMKSLVDLSETNNELIKSLRELHTSKEEVTKSVEVAKPEEDILKSAPIAEVTPEGKAVDFIQKSVSEETNVVATGEVEETEIVAEAEKGIGEQAVDLRGEFMNTYKAVSTNGTVNRGELDAIRSNWLNLGNGLGGEEDLQAVRNFINKHK